MRRSEEETLRTKLSLGGNWELTFRWKLESVLVEQESRELGTQD